MKDLCNCPNCRTDNCPAALELADVRAQSQDLLEQLKRAVDCAADEVADRQKAEAELAAAIRERDGLAASNALLSEELAGVRGYYQNLQTVAKRLHDENNTIQTQLAAARAALNYAIDNQGHHKKEHQAAIDAI